MANVVRPLTQWSRWHRHCCCRTALYHTVSSFHSPFPSGNNAQRRLFFFPLPSSHRSVHFRSRGLRVPNVPSLSRSDDRESGSDSEGDVKKSRNERKRDARRAVRWGMELAAFSPPQIKRILRVASLEREVYDALMLVKRLGRDDVREGKRRQFNYIGRLLREVEPELMDNLIEATKDGDQSRFQGLSDSELWTIEYDEEEEIEYEEGCHNYSSIAARWFDGLINKDIEITNEIYSIDCVEFDRQELRGLVRKVHSIQEREVSSEEDESKNNATLAIAKKSLTRFLRRLAKQLPSD